MPEWLVDLTKWLATAAPLLLAFQRFLNAPNARRARFREDVELLEKLPAGRAHELMQARIIRKLELEDSVYAPSRDTGPMVGALVMTALLAGAVWWLFSDPSWWRTTLGVIAALLMAFFAFGAAESGAEVPRDAKGKRITPAATPGT
ncbi:hypothetical protein FHN55_05040 [Streptomyces sp. NP160]|uniref:hypothetical protein n=1 Tax=Streptomyces sp. NP160 TaxID=2586637 RepID=UPI0011182FA5|nr:hypothetical protein [Streptomyces sp. NP160]TNM69151.1 hypothetical protein FHN55_05040 [Streptomyces sp. NP160]